MKRDILKNLYDDSMNPETDRRGAKRWYNDKGKLHRTDGPAVILPKGGFIWYVNGRIHKEDGPAVIGKSGEHHWFLNDVQYTEEEFMVMTRRQRIKAVLELI